MQLRHIALIAVFFPGAVLGQTSLREACAQGNEQEATSIALANPALALRQTDLFRSLPFGPHLLERLAAAAPDVAIAISDLRTALAQGSPQMQLLAALSMDSAHDLPSRRRAAVLSASIARGALSLNDAWKIASRTDLYFAHVADLRPSAAAGARDDETAAYDRALQDESTELCRSAQQSGTRSLASDFAALRATDIYLALSYGDCSADVFPRAFDAYLLPKLQRGALSAFLSHTGNWRLREFTAAALDAGRFPKLLDIAGADRLAQLALHLSDVNDAVEVAEIIGASRDVRLYDLLARNIAADVREAPILYGLLAARLGAPRAPGESYQEFLQSSKGFETRLLFGPDNLCVERYFFWDDDDGVQSFDNFLRQYEHDPAWRIERRATYVHLTGRGAGGRAIEIYADIPTDIRLPVNRDREGEALRRQAEISAELDRRGIVPTLLVHRGHSYHVEKTLAFVTPAAKLVVLGSCRGVPEIHRVIEASHTAQVIATRGTGAMQINDAILKDLNNRLLRGGATILWADFWRDEQTRMSRSGVFEKYVTPDRDEAAAFLRAYYMARDREQN